MVARVLALRRQPVREVMAPVERIVSVEASTPLSGFYEACRRTGMIRMPVRSPGSVSDFVGIINVFYVVGAAVDASRPVSEHMRPPLFVSADMPVSEVLPRLRLNRQPMALVRAADADQVDAVLSLGISWPASSFEGLSRLALIARWGVGYDMIDVDACTAAGVGASSGSGT